MNSIYNCIELTSHQQWQHTHSHTHTHTHSHMPQMQSLLLLVFLTREYLVSWLLRNISWKLPLNSPLGGGPCYCSSWKAAFWKCAISLGGEIWGKFLLVFPSSWLFSPLLPLLLLRTATPLSTAFVLPSLPRTLFTGHAKNMRHKSKKSKLSKSKCSKVKDCM